jgi:hypothetical protein
MILEGEFVTLECIVISTTPVHGTWFKNNIPLQDNADCRQIQEDKRFQLIIKVWRIISKNLIKIF